MNVNHQGSVSAQLHCEDVQSFHFTQRWNATSRISLKRQVFCERAKQEVLKDELPHPTPLRGSVHYSTMHGSGRCMPLHQLNILHSERDCLRAEDQSLGCSLCITPLLCLSLCLFLSQSLSLSLSLGLSLPPTSGSFYFISAFYFIIYPAPTFLPRVNSSFSFHSSPSDGEESWWWWLRGKEGGFNIGEVGGRQVNRSIYFCVSCVDNTPPQEEPKRDPHTVAHVPFQTDHFDVSGILTGISGWKVNPVVSLSLSSPHPLGAPLSTFLSYVGALRPWAQSDPYRTHTSTEINSHTHSHALCCFSIRHEASLKGDLKAVARKHTHAHTYISDTGSDCVHAQ